MGEGVETCPPNDSSIASLSPPVGGRHRSFRRDWQINKCLDSVLNIITNGYVMPFISKPKLVRAPLIHSGYKALHKEQVLASCIQSLLSKNAIERVENVKSLGFYSCLFLVPQASPKVEASDRPKQAEHLPTCRKVQNGNTRVHQGLSESKGMGVIDRLIRCLPSPPHPPKLKEVPTVLPQVTGVPVHLPSLRTGHSPTGPYNACKGSEVDGPHKGHLASPVPGRLCSDSGRPDSVLRVENKSGEIRTETCPSVFVHGL